MTTTDLAELSGSARQPAEPNPSSYATPLPMPWMRRFIWSVHFTAMIGIAIASTLYGLKIRKDAWDATTQIHFRVTMNNAIRWGQRTNQLGTDKLYDHLVDEFGDDGSYKEVRGALAMDYPPLRLLIVSRWEKWAEQKFPPRHGHSMYWQPQYEFTQPMLWLNNACEFAGAFSMFLLVHYWLRRCSGAPLKPWLDPVRGCWPAMLAALLLWFNPAVIFNAHCYPQWDVWILAPFLLAVYFGFRDWWLPAGIFIGVVAMGKGQILLVTPVLVIWQLCMGRLGAVLRLGTGLFLATGAVASPWLVNNPLAYHWMIRAGIGLAVLLPYFWYRDGSKKSEIILASLLPVVAMVILWPWIRAPRPSHFIGVLFCLLAAAVSARYLPRRFILSWFSAGIAAAFFACVWLFNTSMAWYEIGIKFPTRNWQLLYWCKAMNLGAILQEDFGWEWHETINMDDYLPKFLLTHPVFGPDSFFVHPWVMPMRYLMITAFGITLLMCGIAMAVHDRRKNPMFFFAMVAPWVLMFTLLPQMQNRYLVWAAAFSAATAAFSMDGFMLYLLLAAVSVIDTAVDMMGYSREQPLSQKWLPILTPMFPDMAWGVLLIAGIWLYLALSPGKRKSGTVKPIIAAGL